MRRLWAALIALMSLAWASPAAAWWELGHQTVAGIAQANMSPVARARAQALFRAAPLLGTPKCALRDLRDASTWPDCLRGDPQRWAYSFPWHYQTHDICEPFDPKGDCANGNCVSAQIRRDLALLKDKSLPANVRLEALAFLVHFVGDVHMPLHSGDHEDQGGNAVKASYGIIPGTNLHSIWDGLLAERALTTGPSLVRRYSAAERARWAGGTVDDWGRESWLVARTTAYRQIAKGDPCTTKLVLPIHFTEQQVTQDIPIVRERITEAGLRLARLLDEALQ